MLQNFMMNTPYTERGAGEVKVAEHWEPFFSEGETIEDQGPTARPEYKYIDAVIDERRLYEGPYTQCWFLNNKIMDAGIYQIVTVPVGALVTFSAWVQTWCSDSHDPMADDGEMYFRLGLGLVGEINPDLDSVVWTSFYKGNNEFVKLTVSAYTATPRLTVFIRSWNKWKFNHNDAYVGTTYMSIEGGGGPPSDFALELEVMSDSLADMSERLLAISSQITTTPDEARELVERAHNDLDNALELM